MPLTREQYELRYTRQRILLELTREPYGYTTESYVRAHAGKHAERWFDTALAALIEEGLVARRPNGIELTGAFYRQQEAKERAKKRAAKAKAGMK